MKRLLALAILIAAPSVAMAASDAPKKHPISQENAMSSSPAQADQSKSYELRAEMADQRRAVETQEMQHYNDPYASGVLTEPKDVPTPD